MQIAMNKKLILFSLITLIGLNGFAKGHSEGAELTIRNFRFARHHALDFERLVLEFNGEGAHPPSIKVVTQEKESRISIQGIQLAGGIPEAAINDSYKGTSKYFGPIAINTDSPEGGILIRAFSKAADSKMDAFWLSSPPRLIVDVFPQNSERSFGREVVGQNREFASTNSHKTGHSGSKEHSSPAPRSTDSVVCYPANTQVKPSLGFDKRTNSKGLVMTVEDLQSNRPIGNDILCFPATAQVMPSISFRSGEPLTSLFQGNFEEKPRVFAPAPKVQAAAAPPKANEFSRAVESRSRRHYGIT